MELMSAGLGEDLIDAYESTRARVYLKRLWQRRGYVWFVAHSELRNRQMTTLLGNAWHLLNPAISIAVYWLIFGVILGVDRGVENYTLFITVGILVFADIQRAAVAGSGAIANNRGLLQSLAFPRLLLPLTSTVTESLSSIPSLAVILFVTVFSGETLRPTLLLLPVLLLAVFVMNVGVAMVVARASAHVTDLRQLLPFFFRLLLYGSGVIFSIESYASNRSWGWIFDLNPVYGFISIARWMVMGGPMKWEWLVATTGWSAVLLAFGFFWFRASEETYGR